MKTTRPSPNEDARLALQLTIEGGLRRYCGTSYAPLPNRGSGKGYMKKLEQIHVTQAVVALTHYLGICGSGAEGKIQLYDVIDACVRDPVAAERIQVLLDEMKQERVAARLAAEDAGKGKPVR